MTLTEIIWLLTPFVLSLTLFLATLRAQRTSLTLEDHEYLRSLIQYELAQMCKDEQAPYSADTAGPANQTPSTVTR